MNSKKKVSLDRIHLRNFLSFGNNWTTVDLNIPGTNLILGENRDVGEEGSRNGVGKAQPLYSKILTPTGWTTMGEVEVDDEIITPCGKITEVTGVFPQGLVPTYRVMFSDGRQVDCCGDHLWNIFDGLGVFTTTTLEIIKQLSQYMGVPLVEPVHIKNKLKLSHTGLVSLGMLYKGQELNHQFNYSLKQKEQFLQGILYEAIQLFTSGVILYTSFSKPAAFEIQKLLWSIGAEASLSVQNEIWKIRIRYRSPRKLVFDEDLAVILPENQELFLKILHIKAIEPQESKCISVKHHSKLYITDNYIVTHNTTILQAISVALFNTPLTKIRVNNLVNLTNKKNMEIKLEFTTEWNNNQYMIHIGQKKDFVHLYDVTDGNKDIAADSKAEVVKQIEELIGINSKVFKFIVLFSASNESFLEQSATKQREIIESLFNMDIITEKALAASDLKKECKKNLDFEQFKLTTIKDNNNQFNEMLGKVQRDIECWDTKKRDDLMGLTEALDDIGKIDKDILADEIKIVDALANLHITTLKARDELRLAKSNVTITEKDHHALVASLVALDKEIKHLEDDSCPYCHQDMPEAKKKLEEKTIKHNSLTNELDPIGEEISVQTRYVESCSVILDELKEQSQLLTDSLVYDDLDDIRTLLSEKDIIIKSISDIENSVNPHIQHLQDLKEKTITEIDETAYKHAESEYSHAEFLLKLLNNKNSFIRQRIIGQVIPQLNKLLAEYVDRLGLPHKVKFEKDLSASISQYGREMSFGNLSTGERQRVNLALSFSFHGILSSMHTEIGCLFLDEVLDSGLDEIGVFNTIDVLNEMVREKDLCVYLISHRQEVANIVDRTIHVIKEDGFSRVEVE